MATNLLPCASDAIGQGYPGWVCHNKTKLPPTPSPLDALDDPWTRAKGVLDYGG